MIESKIKELVYQLNSQGEMCFLDAATADQIEGFEAKNGITLPTQYREWLMYSDGGEFFLPAGVQLYGVAHKPLIDVSDDNRPSEDYVVIGALSNGDPIICERDSERILIYNRDDQTIEEDEIYDDFICFLSDLYNMLGIGE